MPNFTFEPVGESKVETLLGMMAALYAEDRSAVFEWEKARDAVLLILRQEHLGRIYLNCTDGETIGYLVITFGGSVAFGGREAFVDELYVRAERRGLGAGTAALEFAAGVCRAEGITALHLEVERCNTRAQDLYRRCGFRDNSTFLLTRRLESE